MKRLSSCAFAFALLAACPESKSPPRRADLRKLSSTTVQIVPAPGQLPYCLVFTTSFTGVVRQLTMNHENKSIKCDADKPIGGVSYRFPIDEGKVRIYLFFSDLALSAGSVAEQIVEKAAEPSFNIMDLRLPGQVIVEIYEFSPEEEEGPMVGEIVGSKSLRTDGGLRRATDAGE